MKKELLSVIVPVYNAGEYLKPLIESILKQTWMLLEVILVDDGSSDGSTNVCEDFVNKDKRVKVVRQTNKGQSEARNTGLKIAKGDFIAFADHDDLLHPQMYEILITEMCKAKADVCACDFLNVDQEKIIQLEFGNLEDWETVVLEQEELVKDYLKPTWRIPIWTKVYSRDILEGMSFSGHHLGEDNLFSYKIIKKCSKMVWVNRKMYFQRMHGNNFEFTGIEYFIELLQAKESILADIYISFPKEYKNAQKLFFYECIRIYNIYIEKGNEKECLKILEIIGNNVSYLNNADIPLGHKWLLFKIKHCKNRINGKHIMV